jgi:hypothetical protein
MVAGTNINAFEFGIDELEDIKGGVIISVIENFICKAVKREGKFESRLETIKGAIKEYLGIVQNHAMKCSNNKIALVQPMQKPLEAWYSKQHKSICKQIDEALKQWTFKSLDIG